MNKIKFSKIVQKQNTVENFLLTAKGELFELYHFSTG